MSIAFVLLAANAVASAPMGQALIQECWQGHSHVEMSACLATKAAAARSTLAGAEQGVSEALAKQGKPAWAALYKSTAQSFQQYRTQQCRLQAALASAGNGATDIRTACEATLDTLRSEQLKAALGWLVPGA
jgi:uncharacterized protein YecT (DUF1311 family)